MAARKQSSGKIPSKPDVSVSRIIPWKAYKQRRGVCSKTIKGLARADMIFPCGTKKVFSHFLWLRVFEYKLKHSCIFPTARGPSAFLFMIF